MQTVPCLVVDCEYEDSAIYSVLENIQRADLSFFEEAQAIAHMQSHFNLTQEQISKKLGKSQSALSNKLRILKLPVDIRYFIEKENLTERHARALLKCDDETQMWQVLNTVKEKKLNVEQTEAYVDALTGKKQKKQKKVVRVFKDVRIFVNTVNKAINTMIEAGIPAEANKNETDEFIEFYVKIPKNAQGDGQNVLPQCEAPQTA